MFSNISYEYRHTIGYLVAALAIGLAAAMFSGYLTEAVSVALIFGFFYSLFLMSFMFVAVVTAPPQRNG